VARETKTAPKKLRGLALEERCLSLRRGGMTYRQIAEELGLSGPGTAYKAVMRALKRHQEQHREDVLTLELQRLDVALAAVWPRVLRGDDRAIQSMLNISAARRRLLGLEKVAVDVTMQGAVIEVTWQDEIKSSAAETAPEANRGGEAPSTHQGAGGGPSVGQDEAGGDGSLGGGDEGRPGVVGGPDV